MIKTSRQKPHADWNNQGRIQKIQKEGTKSPPPPQKKTLLFRQHAVYSIVGVLVIQSKVTLTFQKKELKSNL